MIITAELPPFAKPGQRIDVTVAALGQAKSLRGGTLLLAPMQGANGEIYALAQGSLAVGGFGAEGRDGSRIVVGTPATGRVPAGGIVERTVASPFMGAGPLYLDLNEPDFSAARSVADAINGTGITAAAEDGTRVRIDAPDEPAARISLAARVEELDVTLQAPPARVIVNARTGTVVISGEVRILAAAVAHGNLTVRVTENQQASQPNAFGRGQTVVTQQSSVEAAEAPGRMSLFAPGARLSDIVDAVNALGAAPGDLVAILEALKAAGALRAELVVI